MKNSLVVLLLLSLIFLFDISAYGIEVAIDELQLAKRVVFENYTGAISSPDTIDDVYMIGERLSRGSSSDNEWSIYFTKYSIIHAVSDDEPDKLSADIFSIDKNASVNHIRNIRYIISGFLIKEYGYSKADADLLAIFITFYNAIYRQNMEYFTSRYKKIALTYINEDNAGISTKYNEWAGNTKMLIPLSQDAQFGDISSLDTLLLSDSNVIESLRREDDRAIEEREQIIELQRREVDEMQDELDEQKEEVENDRSQLEDERELIEEEKERFEETRFENTIEEQQEIESRLEEDEQWLEEREAELSEREEDVTELEDNITEREGIIAEREATLEEDKNEIALIEEVRENPEEFIADIREEEERLDERESELDERESELDEIEDEIRSQEPDENIYSGSLYYLKVKDYINGGIYKNDMYIIDAETLEVSVKSSFENISGKKFDIFSEGVVVIGFLQQNLQNHKLVLLDKDTLEPIYTSQEIIFWRSFIEIRDGYIFAVMMELGKYYLGKFNETLELVARSPEPVSENTFVSFFGDRVYVNGPDGDILVFNKEDLSLSVRVMP